MDPHKIIKRNHDLHLHTRDFSDGWHTIDELANFALRWTEVYPWIGVSDHTPLLEDILLKCLPDATAKERRSLEKHIHLNTFIDQYSGISSLIQEVFDAEVEHYINVARSWQQALAEKCNITLLVGLEVEWFLEKPCVTSLTLNNLDYVLMSYHGRQFSDASQAEQFLERIIKHPYTDILAHPDRFLGNFDPRVCDWLRLFQKMADYGVFCEYNLNTPLHPDIFDIAREIDELYFVIASDLHDFRRRSVRRIMDAWSESEGGNFELARNYLLSSLQKNCSPNETSQLASLFHTPDKLMRLESRIYERFRRNNPIKKPLSTEELCLLEYLDSDISDKLDREFLAARLKRFASLSSGRIVSTLNSEQFLNTIHRNRRLSLLQKSH